MESTESASVPTKESRTEWLIEQTIGTIDGTIRELERYRRKLKSQVH